MSLERYLQFVVSIGFCIYGANKEKKETRKVEGKRLTRVWATINIHINSFYMYIQPTTPSPHTDQPAC